MQRLEKTATILAWMFFGGGLLGLGLLFVMYGVRVDQSIFSFGAAVFIAVLVVCNLWILGRPAVDRVGPMISLVVVLSLLALMDLYFGQVERFNPRVARAANLGLPFDERTILDAVLDIRDEGRSVYPTVTPRQFYARPLGTREGNILPYALPSDSEIVLCNEQGHYVSIRTDEKGFVNPHGVWSRPGNVDVLLIGDSFAEGWCVAQEDSAASLIRSHGWGLINVGRGGLGPIGALGAVREFATATKPKAVAWLFFEGNDFADFRDELQVPLLSKYLDREWRQHLLERSDSIDEALRNYVERKLDSYRWRAAFPFLKWRQALPKESMGALIRKTFGTADTLKKPSQSAAVHSDVSSDSSTISTVIRQVIKEIQQHKALPLFVYLPDIHAFPERRPETVPAKRQVLQAAHEAGAVVIDLERAFHEFASDPRELFPMRIWGHYNERGHSILAKVIEAELSQKLRHP